MKYDEDANHKLFWAIIVALIGVTCMILATGCSTAILAKDCNQIKNEDQWFKCTKPKPWE